ncbi:hypothetical protein QFZ34_000500 [Phyllobacterium ifriqiyense]|uniref:Uncharacterized protein n=1 Tax=Phyllobacterium ifriqiyense TaxID=314238 RepID=A0ABU0S3L5_9HYPH|nr:hypothetical protein [Phyllobacterium ifriqiyense]
MFQETEILKKYDYFFGASVGRLCIHRLPVVRDTRRSYSDSDREVLTMERLLLRICPTRPAAFDFVGSALLVISLLLCSPAQAEPIRGRWLDICGSDYCEMG